ncbi:transglycosylase domain-containing protein [Anaerobranca gottschalkii]|uniref:Penicillin-binding protein 1A n=1 Tax=Anaerobranca gottschalkii DSM 13577 TaxID=1120990 RepID=A0A1I0B3A7_9FIRM|nr:biosynthetic peptidoglycan transglycosylase [Anaerobranca gottschalkii]SET00592.1 Transglycosylase [Anaerobranca gottschalkii DSM 13577]
MKLFKKLLKLSIICINIIIVVFLSAYLSLVVPSSPYYINWDEPSPIFEKHRPIYLVEGILIREYKENKIEFISIEEMPDHLIYAFIAVEDNRFFNHKGFDIKGILRAFKVNAKNRDIVQGGSTITQQLARNLFLHHEQTIQRKLLELVISIKLERRYSKEEILEMYLNQIYFGNGNYGVERAAQKYFNTSAKDLTVEQAAMLAGIIKAPGLYNPLTNPQLAEQNQRQVLMQMITLGFIEE